MRSTPLRRTLRVIAILSVIVGIVWFWFEPGFEPLTAFLTALFAWLPTLVPPRTLESDDKDPLSGQTETVVSSRSLVNQQAASGGQTVVLRRWPSHRMLRDPQLRDALAGFRSYSRVASSQVDKLKAHKDIHEFLSKMKDHCKIINDEHRHLNRQTPESRWVVSDLLRWQEPELQGVIDDLLNVGGRAAFVGVSPEWTGQLSRAQQELRLAVDRCDREKLESALDRLDRMLKREPFRVNTCLV